MSALSLNMFSRMGLRRGWRCLSPGLRDSCLSSLATKIMFEAHNNGKSIAEVEGEETAKLHCQQLQSFRLTATVEKI